MRKHRFVCWLLTFPLWLGQAWAAEGAAGSSWGWWETLGRWVNLGIVVGLLVYYLREPIGKFFQDRRRRIQQEMEEADRSFREATQRLAEVQSRLEGLDAELAELRREAQEEARLEKERILEEGEREAQRLVGVARREIENLTRAAQKDLRELAARLAVETAQERIRRELTSDDEKRIVERFLIHLGGRRPA